MVLNGVVCSSWYVFRNFSPFVTVDFVRLNENIFFVIIPSGFPHLWVQMIVPPLPTLFSISIRARDAIFELVGDNIPPFGSEFLYEYGDKNIFFN
jgi:hypothetical protein